METVIDDQKGCYSGEVRSSKPNIPHGEGVFVTQSGNIMKGSLRDGQWDGLCKRLLLNTTKNLLGHFTYANGKIWIGEVKKNQREGKATEYSAA